MSNHRDRELRRKPISTNYRTRPNVIAAWGALQSRRIEIESGDESLDETVPFLVVKAGRRGSPKGEPDKEAAFDALASKFDPNDYDDWISEFGMLLVAAFGKDDLWALDRWLEWGGQHNKFDETQARTKWGSLNPDQYSAMSFWRQAQEAGYRGPLPFGDVDLDTYNKKHAMIRNKNKVGVLCVDEDPRLKRKAYSIVSKGAFLTLDPSKDAKAWVNSEQPYRRTYENGFIFDPSGDHEGYFNLWEGWSVTPTPGAWPLLREHIETQD